MPALFVLVCSTAFEFAYHSGFIPQAMPGTPILSTASIEIHNNTFRAPQTPVVIRGVPQEKCDVHHNWFPQHPEPGLAVRASAKTNHGTANRMKPMTTSI